MLHEARTNRTHFSSLVSTRLNMGTLRVQECNEKQTVTRLLLAIDTVWGTHLLNMYAFTIKCRWILTVSSKTWNRSSSSPQVWLLSFSMASFKTSSSRTCGRPQRVTSQRTDLPTWTSKTNVWWCVLSQHYLQRLDLFGDLVRLRKKPDLKS